MAGIVWGMDGSDSDRGEVTGSYLSLLLLGFSEEQAVLLEPTMSTGQLFTAGV